LLSVSLTGGQKGTYGTPETRAKEFAAANEIMGIDGVVLDFPDTEVENTPAARLQIARIVRVHRPQLVLAPYHMNRFDHHDGSANRDHSAAGRLVRDALKLARFRDHHDGSANRDHSAAGRLVRDALKLARFRNVLPDVPPHDVQRLFYYMVPKDMMPTFIVDVSDVIEDVRRAIAAYESQMKIWRVESSIIELLDTLRRYHGLRIGRRYGEAFLSDEALAFGPDDFFRV
jgi:LmbE family N-acetylglucosaminyl deacetylase